MEEINMFTDIPSVFYRVWPVVALSVILMMVRVDSGYWRCKIMTRTSYVAGIMVMGCCLMFVNSETITFKEQQINSSDIQTLESF